MEMLWRMRESILENPIYSRFFEDVIINKVTATAVTFEQGVLYWLHW